MPKFNHNNLRIAFLSKRLEMTIETDRYKPLRTLAKQIKVSPSTLSRLQNGKKLDIDSILLVCDWMGKKITDFIK